MNNFEELVKSLSSYLYLKLDIETLPKLILKKDKFDDVLCKTAFYDPENSIIYLYVSGRHPKDILRSFSHEMVHHKQNEQNRLGEITTTNIREDKSLITFEMEAYLLGNMLFRNWETAVKNGEI